MSTPNAACGPEGATVPIGTATDFARLRSRHMLAGRKHPLPPHNQWKYMVPLVPAVELARGGRQRCT